MGFLTNFNPRSLAGATPNFIVCYYTTVFQSTLPRGSDEFKDVNFYPSLKFQSTLPRGSDFCVNKVLVIAPKFQSTLPRGSDHEVGNRVLVVAISIHAPSRERLYLPVICFLPDCISIHAPSRERPDGLGMTVPAVRFQSTLPRGSDLLYRYAAYRASISIHAPSRERRLSPTVAKNATTISIHAPSRERQAIE